MRTILKKSLVGAAGLLLSFAAFATTFTPISLLNPVGSTSGQAIVSTGASSAPVWGNISAAALTGILPVLNGGTGVTSAAAEVTRLSAAVTTGTLAQFAPTTSAQLATLLTDETGTGANVFGTSPTITTPNIVGVTNGSAAAAGSVGELLSANASSVAFATGTALTCVSKSLTAGDWDVWGVIDFASTGLMTSGFAGAGTTANTLPSFPNAAGMNGITFGSGAVFSLAAPMQTINVSTTTTAFLVGQTTFTSGGVTGNCTIWARRRH